MAGGTRVGRINPRTETIEKASHTRGTLPGAKTDIGPRSTINLEPYRNAAYARSALTFTKDLWLN